ncbi:MAG TPA: hypothetical protein DDZ51_29350 [Planctomycetaceae bacterium]|nr:hypothetical protein [Planctomycetaceae bacterium]
MTWALCFNCGEVKFGAICPCPKCEVASTGDMNLDIAFSDHNMTKATLENFGKVVETIQSSSSDKELCFWTFIRYISTNHPSILGVELKPELATKCDSLLSQIELPAVAMVPSKSKILKEQKAKSQRRWWQFWRKGTDGDGRDSVLN